MHRPGSGSPGSQTELPEDHGDSRRRQLPHNLWEVVNGLRAGLIILSLASQFLPEIETLTMSPRQR